MSIEGISWAFRCDSFEDLWTSDWSLCRNIWYLSRSFCTFRRKWSHSDLFPKQDWLYTRRKDHIIRNIAAISHKTKKDIEGTSTLKAIHLLGQPIKVQSKERRYPSMVGKHNANHYRRQQHHTFSLNHFQFGYWSWWFFGKQWRRLPNLAASVPK